MTPPPGRIIGVFTTPEAILAAATRLHSLGFRAVKAYAPYPVAGLDTAAASPARPTLPQAMLLGGVLGAGCGYFLQYWAEVLSYPLDVGGRPYASWPAFTVSAFELMLLFAVAAGFFALFAVCRLPRLYHPIFAAAAFDRVSRDRFALCVEASDPSFEPAQLRRVFESCGAEEIAELGA